MKIKKCTQACALKMTIIAKNKQQANMNSRSAARELEN